MASNNPLAPNPDTSIDKPKPVPEPLPEDPKEDLGEAVPLGEPEDEGFTIQEEQR